MPSPRRGPPRRCSWSSRSGTKGHSPRSTAAAQKQAKVWPKEKVEVSHGGSQRSGSGSNLLEEDEGEIEDFFDQVWVVPSQLPQARVSNQSNLFWIRRDLWEKREFGRSDMHPV